MHDAEEVRKEAETLDAGRIRERDAKEMLLAYADLLEAIEELDQESRDTNTVARIRQRAAEKQKARKG